MGILDIITSAGIVGCGGAGFPTHVKLKGKFEYLVVNGAECEPILNHDRFIMRNHAPELVEAITAVVQELHIEKAVIALKEHYHEESVALRKAVSDAGAAISLCEMDSFYPAGDEQTIVYEATGRVVPPAGLPSEVGVVVNNVATLYAVYEAMHGTPLIWKYMTIAGEVAHPIILRVPVGTSFRSCLDQAGGMPEGDYVIVSGGPMMGPLVKKEDLDTTYVTKTTSGILVLPKNQYFSGQETMNLRHMLNRARSACIQCTSCTMLCPRYLLGHPLEPHRIMRQIAGYARIDSSISQDMVLRTAQLCCECGMCEIYACPMGLQPREVNRVIKRQLAADGVRYQRTEDHWEPRAERELRKAPSARAAARVGVSAYDGDLITDLVRYEPDQVTISLKMHIGAPDVPAVQEGDFVSAGDIIARPPEGKLGAVIHASISGRVTRVGKDITIVKE